jgi:hypothetical protein
MRAAGVQGCGSMTCSTQPRRWPWRLGANTRELMERMGRTLPTVALRYQHVMGDRDQAIAAALDELVQDAANLPPQRPAEPPSGTNQARELRGSSRRAAGGC